MVVVLFILETLLFNQQNNNSLVAQSKLQAPEIELTEIGSNLATIQWTSMNGATYYYIFACDDTNTCNIGIAHPPTDAMIQTRRITDLKPSNDYSITVTAYNGETWSDYTNWLFIRTKKDGSSTSSFSPAPPPTCTATSTTQTICHDTTTTKLQTQYSCNGVLEWKDTSTTPCCQGKTCSNGVCVGTCTTSPPPPPPPPSCTQNSDCTSNRVCQNGTCVSTTVQTCAWQTTSNRRNTNTCTSSTTISTQQQTEQVCGPSNCQGGTTCTRGQKRWVNTGSPTTATCSQGKTCSNGVCTPALPPPPPSCSWVNTGTTQQQKTCTDTHKVSITTQVEQRCGPSDCTGKCSGNKSRGSTKWIDRGIPTTSTCAYAESCNSGTCTLPPPECTLQISRKIGQTGTIRYTGSYILRVNFSLTKKFLTMWYNKDDDIPYNEPPVSIVFPKTRHDYDLKIVTEGDIHATPNPDYSLTDEDLYVTEDRFLMMKSDGYNKIHYDIVERYIGAIKFSYECNGETYYAAQALGPS